MGVNRGCVVVASAFPSDVLCAHLRKLGFAAVECVGDGLSALRLVQSRLPDALVADAVLPGLQGDALVERVRRTPLTVYPAMVLLTLPGMPLRSQTPDCAVLEKSADADALASALARLAPERRPVPPDKRRQADMLLTRLGVPEHCGRDYLLRAVEMAWADSRMLRGLTTRLYPAIAAEFSVDRRHVERSMRHVIDTAWRSGEIEAQYALFGDTIDARRGNPTCGEMIARIADILRWEGNA